MRLGYGTITHTVVFQVAVDELQTASSVDYCDSKPQQNAYCLLLVESASNNVLRVFETELVCLLEGQFILEKSLLYLLSA
jgi:hypothetical protein